MQMARTILFGFLGALCLFAAQATAQEIPQPLLGNCCSCTGSLEEHPPGQMDSIRVAARVLPVSAMNPFDEGFVFELENAGGVLFSGTLAPGDMDENSLGRRWTFSDPAARTSGGLLRVLIQEMTGPLAGYVIQVLAYGDLSAATDPTMTVRMAVGGDAFFDTSLWVGRRNGFRHGYW